MLEAGERWRVVEGDCRPLLAAMPAACVDLVLTDPPYGHSNNDDDLIGRWEEALGEKRRAGAAERRPIANDGPEANELVRGILPELSRVLKSPGCCCCCCCGGGGPDPQFARWSLWLDEVFRFKQMVVWDKGPMGMGWHYRRSYETVLVAEKRGPGACRWEDSSGRVENIIRPGDYGIRKILPGENDHPTPKPWQLAAHFVRLHSSPGDLVLDPFAGHRWVGVACMKLGRRYLGFEIDPAFAEAAGRKVAEAADGDALFTHTHTHTHTQKTGLFGETQE